MLKLSRHIFCWNPSVTVADYYERALFNHILGQQDPETGMLCYFLPLADGSYKVYSTPENSFWCCVGSGFESNAKYAESIYFHDSGNVYVNLFIPSVLDWKEKGITLIQNTAFPEDDRIEIVVGEASGEKASVRKAWCRLHRFPIRKSTMTIIHTTIMSRKTWLRFWKFPKEIRRRT